MPHIAELLADDKLSLSPYNATMQVLDSYAGLVQATPSRSKVIIRGAGGGRNQAPTDDLDAEIWSLNAVTSVDSLGRLRADRWFDLHEMHAQNAKDMEWIRHCPCPIYLVPSASTFRGSCIEYNPLQVRYPLEVIEESYGSYFACSFAYMIALALLEGFDDIGLYGCELAYGTERERTMEWANVSWWMGLAEGLGRRIHLPKESKLGRHVALYGIEYNEEKRLVEDYVTLMRRADVARGIDKSLRYDSGKEDWIGKPERAS